ncbi:hypothetical protein A2U01_0098851, partial [Trifolium medium]|nr:hypothetical protein [Trifolium medium]
MHIVDVTGIISQIEIKHSGRTIGGVVMTTTSHDKNEAMRSRAQKSFDTIMKLLMVKNNELNIESKR